MSSKSNKGEKPVAIQFEDILAFVQDFSYDSVGAVKKIDDKPTDEPMTVTNPKNLNAIRKVNLAKMLAMTAKIKSAVFADKQTQKNDIEKLYSLIAGKMGTEMYKIDISFCIKFLAGYNNKKANKIELSIRTIFDCIRQKSNASLVSWEVDILSFTPTALSENGDTEFACKFKTAIADAVKRNCIGNEPKAIKEQLISAVYVALLLGHKDRLDFDKFFVVVERTIAEYIAELELRDVSKCLIKSVPEALLDANPKTKVRSTLFLYFGVVNALAESRKESACLSAELGDSKAKIHELVSEVHELSASCECKEKTIHELQDEIVVLKERLSASNDRLEYEANMYEKQLGGLKFGIYAKIRQDLQLELEGIANIAKKLPPKEAEDLQLWLANIKQIIDTIGGKK